MCMPQEDCLIEAFNRVLDFGLPDHLISCAVAQESKLMAGFDAEEPYHDIDDDYWMLSPESIVAFQ